MLINVLEYLEAAEVSFPNKIAISCEEGSCTYSEALEYSRRIGSRISKIGSYNSPVFIFLDKTHISIMAFFGTLYSGNYYVPIDVEQPDDRIKKLINTIAPPLVITNKLYEDRVRGLLLYSKINILLIEDALESDVEYERLDRIRARHIDTNPAYMMFTSGSTGVPKGVVISHQSIIDYVEWLVDFFEFSANDRFGNQAPLFFDNSVLDIYGAMKVGATVYIIPKICFHFYAMLRDYLKENMISVIFFVPSILCNMARIEAFDEEGFPNLRKILFCGEVMPVCYLNVWKKHVPNALYANLYGPTEITDVCSAYIVDRDFNDDELLPIGKACKNTEIIILSATNEEVGVNEIGEICVRGRSLALGYYGDNKKSNEVFIQNPLNEKYRDLIYRTGDLGKINSRGEIICLGRKDYQIKHQGFRIELGEIENAALNIIGIDECVCVYDNINRIIWLIYSGDIESVALKKEIQTLLPDYMVPKRYKKVDSLPHTSNGKINRKNIMQAIKEN